jgi:hypothetical protein
MTKFLFAAEQVQKLGKVQNFRATSLAMGFSDKTCLPASSAFLMNSGWTRIGRLLKKALLAGKHVLSEKPIAKDVATAQELLKWYKSNILRLNQNRKAVGVEVSFSPI